MYLCICSLSNVDENYVYSSETERKNVKKYHAIKIGSAALVFGCRLKDRIHYRARYVK
jgi:hypothetical protein